MVPAGTAPVLLSVYNTLHGVVEKRAAIETGQEQENINLNGQISQAGIDAAKVFTVQELEEFERRYRAKAEEERQLKAQVKLLPAPEKK